MISNLEHKESAITSQDAITVSDLDFYYGNTHALKSISLHVPEKKVTAFIGPSGCGKSTLLRCINRMNDDIPGARVAAGHIHVKGHDIYQKKVDVVKLRYEVGMVFQKSNPFPQSIFENVAYGLRLRGMKIGAELNDTVEKALTSAALWDEVKDRLHENAYGLSGGQQQRLCIARAIAVDPHVILMDEPCSALDPIATSRVEDLIWSLKDDYTFVIVTHSMQQAARVSDHTAFFYMGQLIEADDTSKIFSNPTHKQTENYISGRIG